MGQASILVALLTPFTPGGEVDREALAGHAAELQSAGVDGFFVCGTTGEGPLLDDEEVASVTRTVIGICGGSCRVIVQVGRASTKATLRLLSRVLDLGAHGVTAVTPYYYELDDAKLEGHYKQLIHVADNHPTYAYVIPRRAGNDITPQLSRTLAESGLAGIKDSTRSLERHLAYLEIAREPGVRNFEVYMGTDSLAFDAFENGSNGLVSAIANAHPEMFVCLRRAMVNGRIDEARKYQDEINAVRQSMSHGDTITQLKSAVSQRWQGCGFTYPRGARPPLG